MRRLRMEPVTISPIRTTIVAAPKPATYFSRRDITVENSTLAADVRPRTYRSCPFGAETRRKTRRKARTSVREGAGFTAALRDRHQLRGNSMAPAHVPPLPPRAQILTCLFFSASFSASPRLRVKSTPTLVPASSVKPLLLLASKAFRANHPGTLADDHQLAGSHFRNLLDRSVRPANRQARGGRGAEPEMQPAIVDRKIGRLGHHRLRLPALPIRSHHLGANRTAVGGNPDQQDLQPVIGPANVIAQQRRRLVEIHHQDVDVAVVIEIAESHSPAAMRLGDAGPRQVAQFFEFAVSQIAKNHAGRLVGGIRRLLFHFGIDHAGGEEEVGKAVVVQVHDARAPTDVPGFHAEARADRYVAEIALPVVAVED